MKKTVQQGFTLIELMIVVAIIGILAAVALPAYQDYVIKSKMSEVILATSQCRTTVSEIYQTKADTGALTNNGWGCGESTSEVTQYVASIQTDGDSGVITVEVQNVNDDINGETITLTPQDSNGDEMSLSDGVGRQVYKFACEGSATLTKYLPGSCR